MYKTERLILRPTNETDDVFIFELMNTPKFLHFIGDRNIRNVEDAKNYIATKMLPHHQKLGFGNYTIIRKEDQVKIGTCGLYSRDGVEGVDIGFVFLPAFEKMGYAFESTEFVKNLGIEKFGINPIYAYTTKTNLSSQKLLEKLGLKHTKMTYLPNDPEELMQYEVENEKIKVKS